MSGKKREDEQVHAHLGYLGNRGGVHVGERGGEGEDEGIPNLNSRLIKGRITLETTTG